MSRLIVKSLPKGIKETRLRDLFAAHGAVTECCLKFTAGGVFRKFAFIGFKNEQDAEAARAHLNNTYIDTTKIQVEACLPLDAVGKPKPWSKHTKAKDAAKDAPPAKAANEKKKKKRSKPEVAVAASDLTGRLFVRNLSYGCTEDELRAHFDKFGEISDVTFPMDKFTQRSKGFAIVTFLFAEHAVRALDALDGTIFQGRMLHVLPGAEKPGDDTTEKKAPDTFKSKKTETLKRTTNNWNTLFLGTNAVVDVLAKKYDVEKSDILSVDTSTKKGMTSVGVRVALGETQIVHQTREFLVENGVALDCFGKIGTRSKTVVVVKNLPARTQADELRALFEPFGELGRLLIPPFGVTALVEFLDAADARRAFNALSYRRFHTTPLFLEWAPEEVFTKETPATSSTIEEGVKIEEGDAVKVDEKIDEVINGGTEGTCLFVKNLNFATTDDALRLLFEPFGALRQANIARHRGGGLSKGFGFVEFERHADAFEALKKAQGMLLDGHRLELRISAPREKPSAKGRKGREEKPIKSSAKLLVRNVAFQATKREVEALFATFGELKAVRLPKKVGASTSTGSGHRGFAFVEFAAEADAQRAFEALGASTHLYGRRLVLEYSTAGDDAVESVDEVRRRTRDHIAKGDRSGERTKVKRRKVMQMLEGGEGGGIEEAEMEDDE